MKYLVSTIDDRPHLGAVTKLPVLFLYFVTAPYAVPNIYLTKLFLNNGLGDS